MALYLVAFDCGEFEIRTVPWPSTDSPQTWSNYTLASSYDALTESIASYASIRVVEQIKLGDVPLYLSSSLYVSPELVKMLKGE